MHPLARPAVAGIVLALLQGPSAGAASSPAAEREPEPLQTKGTAVQGGGDLFTAPLLSAGTFTDSAPADGDTSFYRVRRSTQDGILRVGTTTYEAEGLEVRVLDALGQECGTDTGWTLGLVVGNAGDDEDPVCENSDQVVVAVTNTTKEPQERPFELHVAEEPAVPTTAGLPKPQESVDWTDMKASAEVQDTQGGLSLAEAPEVSPEHSVRGSVVAGEARLYKVPAEWGQRVQARVSVNAESEGLESGAVTVTLVGADRRELDTEASGAKDARASFWDHDEAVAETASLPVAWNNRDGQGPTLPGDQYVVVTADESGEEYRKVPFTLTVAVLGDAVDAPRYAEGSAPSEERDRVIEPGAGRGEGDQGNAAPTGGEDSGGSTSSAATGGDERAASAGSSDGGPSKPVLWGGGALGGLMLLAGALALVANRARG
ncbi:hypothetical protein CYJ76_00440 [Kytococcus schroeteri]|uniref:Peptidase n=1 Tax=Kytococcus schroeteri TaxID=138300 RepID=A0A2I1PDS1_9MICO|nr:hypothetical protein [Kytococcus schroeteri]PKZ42764.1 hypothetical protein CYJ76_00440 [Kytococcus schroeteri]